jgi:hypothetical protein
VHITFERLGRGVRVVVRDFGSGAGTIGGTSQRDIGGLGWKIVEALADRCTVKSSFAEGTEVSMSFGTLSPATATR